MALYFGILDGNADVWGVRVPDLVGVHGGGETAREALEDAISAAREWVDVQGGRSIAEPRAMEEVLAEVEQGETLVLIPVLIDRGRSVRANLSIDAGLLEDIDRAAKYRGLTRSSFIASAAQQKILETG